MKIKNLPEMSNEELLKHEKSMKTITYIFAGTLIVLFAIKIYEFYEEGFSVISIFPVFLLPILFLNFRNLKDIKIEKQKRNL